MSYVSGHCYDRKMTLGIVAACAAVMTQAEGKGAKCWRTESKGFHSEAPFRCYWISGVHSPEAVTVCGGHAFIGALVAFTGDTDAMGAGCQSTTYGKWIAGDLHIDHCWDNIRLPVLFKTNIIKTVTDQGIGGIVFFEIAPRPYLKRGVEQCDGKCISLFRRPNPNERTSTSTNSTHFLTSGPSSLSTLTTSRNAELTRS
ncbi:hypothetical protein SCLCIDRAFT_28304 [Scleroderma citrinum Foug A]|uniref:Uncharacterized protein n=1 Tax=Scleroderma citrinum Foug A TaxID=1036808 RepID=A0A0C3DPM6_9AGAM|nr:hypothetical protein SCLCIDRAFT_28304 [Scleroderma citrinum Foug A]